MADATPAAPAAPASSTSTTTEAPTTGGAEAKAPADAGKTAAQQELSELFDLNVNGKVEKVTRDQLVARAQKAEAAERKFREAAEKEKRVESWKERAKKGDIASIMKDLGVDFDTAAEERLLEKMRQAELTPEQRALAEKDAKIKQYEEERAAREKETAEAQQKAALAQTAQHVERMMLDAADKAGFPKNPDTLLAMAEIGLEAAQYGVPLTPEHIVSEMKARQESSSKTAMEKLIAKLSGLEGEKLLGELPPALIEKLLKASVAKVRGGGNHPPPTTPAPMAAVPPKDPPAPTRPHEFFKTRFR